MPGGSDAGRVFGDNQALLTDPVEQRGMASRVGDIDPACEYRDGEPVGCQRGAVRCPVDAVGTAGHNGRIPPRQACSQFRGNVFAVRGSRSGPHDGRRALGHLVKPRWPPHPQRQRRMRLWPLLGVDTAEGGEGQQRPFGVRSADQASTQSLQYCQITGGTLDLMTGFGGTR